VTRADVTLGNPGHINCVHDECGGLRTISFCALRKLLTAVCAAKNQMKGMSQRMYCPAECATAASWRHSSKIFYEFHQSAVIGTQTAQKTSRPSCSVCATFL
jgi:hypothetical protein